MWRGILMAAVLAVAGMAAAVGTAAADPIGGTIWRTAVIGGYETHEYRVACHGGEATRVVIKGDGDSDLDLYVYDKYGRLLGKDDDSTDTCVVSFWLREAQVVTIRVVNRGRMANRYEMLVD